jgi:hypothetical protein
LVFFLNEAFSLTAGIVGIEAPADAEDEEDDRDDSSSGRVVIVDESYFVENPLARIQITDGQGYAVEILESSGIVKDGNSVEISQQWQVPEVSAYEIKIMVWTLPGAGPVPLAASVSKTIEAHS